MFSNLQQTWDNLDFYLEWRYAGMVCCRMSCILVLLTDIFSGHSWTHLGIVINKMAYGVVGDAQACAGCTGLSLSGEGAIWLRMGFWERGGLQFYSFVRDRYSGFRRGETACPPQLNRSLSLISASSGPLPWIIRTAGKKTRPTGTQNVPASRAPPD